MIDIITQRASLVGQVIEDLTHEPLEPGRFSVELVGVERVPQYKPGGLFVFSDLPPDSYNLRISGKRFQILEYLVTISPPNLIVDSPGDDELFVVASGIDPANHRITFDQLILSREIRQGASVRSSGFSSTLAATLDAGAIAQARLDDTTGLAQDSIVRIHRSRSFRLKFDPYYSFPPGLTIITGKVIIRHAPGSPPDAPELPLSGAQVRLEQIDSGNVVLNNVEGVNIATVEISGTQTILGVGKDITSLTNQNGDYILYFQEHNLPASFTNMRLEATLAEYQPEPQTTAINRGQRNTVNFELSRI